MGERRAWTERSSKEKLEITPRDIEILKAVHRYRFLSSSQITGMFFRSKSFADRRLRKLYDCGFLDRIQRPAAEGKAELLYALWTEGAKLLARELGVSKEELGWSKSKNRVRWEFLDHELEVNRFRSALEGACRNQTGYAVDEWRTKEELKLKKGNISFGEKIREGKKNVTLIPDAYFVLKTPKGRAHFFLEVDMYTETASRVFRKKMRSYKMYFERGLFGERFGGKSFRVLTVTTNKTRLNSLVKVMGELGLGIIFWFTASYLISPETILKEIWIRADKPEELVKI